MNKKIAEHPFLFTGCWELREMLGRSARDEQQLLEAIEEIPLDSIYYHTHSFFLRHKYIAGPYPNDFATWAAIQVRDRVLGEKLGILDPYDFESLESLRAEIVTIIEEHLSQLQIIPRAIYGEPFHFMQSRIIEVPTGLRARTLTEFREILAGIDASVVYYHTFEAILRLGRRKGDFALWIEEQLGLPELAKKISLLDPYRTSLESIRHRIIKLCDEVMEKRAYI
ncbi:MAG: hypothetical protein FJ117_22710 [Deltaproteobacteria bacterium]|nr:hypothetical protein [Deltaproteobacteria bacterium]